MDAPFHRKILERALGGRVSARALRAICRANIGQDSPSGLLGHPEYHFDDNAIAESLAYLEACRALAAHTESVAEAWAAFGRLTHAAQDFYAHSNYVRLWAEQNAKPSDTDGQAGYGRRQAPADLPPLSSQPEMIDGLDPKLLTHPRLMTCRMYWPLEALSLIPGLGPLIKQLFPADSHARMNLDNPTTGPLFPYAIEAAVQRTRAEFEHTMAMRGEERGEEAVKAFCDG